MLKQEGCDLMGAAFEVYNVLGYGIAEEIYQQNLEIELGLTKIPFQTKAELTPHPGRVIAEMRGNGPSSPAPPSSF